MGGFGSGWHGKRGGKSTIDAYRSVDVRRWQREGMLLPGTCFTWTWTEQGRYAETIDVIVKADRAIIGGTEVLLQSTQCNLGGRRSWFICPECRRRRCVLYRAYAFACRQCLRLAYPVEREASGRRALRRAKKVFRRWNIEHGRPEGKPKWQRWPTYKRLAAAAEEACKVIAAAESAPYDSLQRVMDRKPRRCGRMPKPDR